MKEQLTYPEEINEEHLESLMQRGIRVTCHGKMHIGTVDGQIGHNGCDIRGYYVYYNKNQNFWGGGKWGREILIESGNVLEWVELRYTGEYDIREYKFRRKVELKTAGGEYGV